MWEAKFFAPFWVLHTVRKQTYKLELFKKWKIYNVFYVSLLEQDITKKELVDKKVPKLDVNEQNSKEYKVEAIWNCAIYARLLKGHLSCFYYQIACKGYSKEENTWELLSAVQHLRKLIHSFYKNHLEKSAAISPPINSAPPMARLTIKPTRPTKQKRG